MTERRWEPIVPHLREFQRHLAAHIPELRIVPANDRRWSEERYREQCKNDIFEQYGVYLIFDANESLEYVGIAMNRFHDRIWSHDTAVDRTLTDVILISHEYYFLGLALEFFLIARLRPLKNATYRSYSIQARNLSQ